MTRGWILVAALVAAVPASAPAQSSPAVAAARQSGVIGERFDGYLGYVVAPSAVVRSQVDAVNIRRRALFSNLAVSRGATPGEVGITAGCQLLARVAVGEAYLLSDGAWRRRAAGQAAPVPDYCR